MIDTSIVNDIIATTQGYFTYILPVIAVMSGVVFIVSWLMSLTVGLAKRTFRG